MLLALTLAATAAFAFTQPADDRRYEDKIQQRLGGVISVKAISTQSLEPGDALRRGWDAFAEREGGRWAIYIDARTGMPTMASGRIAWFGGAGNDLAPAGALDLDRLEAQARTFLENNTSVLGNWAASLELDRDASAELDQDKWQLIFRQRAGDLLVDNSKFTFLVAYGNLVQFGASRISPVTISTTPALSAEGAVDKVNAYLGTDGSMHHYHGDPELVLVAIDPARGPEPKPFEGTRGSGVTHVLAWRIQFEIEGEEQWEAEVDAHTGQILAFTDASHYLNIRGGVYPAANDEDCATQGCEINNYPMPFADFSVDGGAAQTTDDFGNFTCNPGSTVSTSLNGPFVEIDDVCGPVAETRSCGGAFDLDINAGTNCDSATGDSAGNTGASRSAFYHVNRVAQMARHYMPGLAFVNNPVVTNTNVNNTCNATWGGQINMFRAGNGCSNTGENAGVLTHEWGHGLDQNDGGGFDRTSEAYADVVAIFYSRESCIGRGFRPAIQCSGYGDTCLNCTGVRDHDWAARTFNTPPTPAGFVENQCGGSGSSPCGRSVHCESYPIGGSIFDLATRDLPAMGLDADSAWQLAERLWYQTRDGSSGDIYNCSLPDSDSCGASSWYQRMRVADDDDGDLSNGTPHAAALFAAFDRHAIACGDAADPENQNSSSCPALAQPSILVSNEPGGTRVDWAAVPDASAYLVLRSDNGCNRQHVILDTVAAPATTYLDTTVDPSFTAYYRIQAIGANAACESPVSACVAQPDGANLVRMRARVEDGGALGNGTGTFDPGETLQLPVSLYNRGTETGVGVVGRLRAVDPDQARVLIADATYPDIAVNAEVESNAPHFELVVQPSVQCGDVVSLELDSSATNAPMDRSVFSFTLGTFDDDVTGPTGSVPRGTTDFELPISEDRMITELDTSVDFSLFGQSFGIDLISPAGTQVTLVNNNGGFFGIDTRFDQQTDPIGPGTMDDFVGESTQGTWILRVRNGAVQSGTLQGWVLHLSVSEPLGCTPQTCADPTPGATDGLRVNRVGDDLSFEWDPATGASGYHLLGDSVKTFESNELVGTAAGTTLTLPGAAIGGADIEFFRVRAINSCNWEGP
ncbi:hypothetical protein ABI59_19680 [Acidobacteria bacterium Mor1]|nr:hypothetical protein ABI59_19680 [Acidobacteria bacterium Mor1]